MKPVDTQNQMYVMYHSIKCVTMQLAAKAPG